MMEPSSRPLGNVEWESVCGALRWVSSQCSKGCGGYQSRIQETMKLSAVRKVLTLGKDVLGDTMGSFWGRNRVSQLGGNPGV